MNIDDGKSEQTVWFGPGPATDAEIDCASKVAEFMGVSMPEYESRVIAMVVSQPGKDLFDDDVTRIEIDDEAGGEFVVISQSADDCGKVKIDPQEWPAIRKVIDRMVKGCRG